MGGRRVKEKETKSMSKWKKVLLIILVIILMLTAILAGVATFFIANKLGKIQIEEIDETAVGINESTSKALSGYRNIALLGIDSRADDYGVRKQK